MDVVAALLRCRTTAERYRVQINAENLLAPTDVMELVDQVSAVSDEARAWIGKFAEGCTQVSATTQPFRHRRIAETVSFYEGSGPPGAARSLVVAFTGMAQRMTMPTAHFLQALPAERCDVVVLRDPDRVAFLSGVPGYAADLPALAEALRRDVPFAHYADRRCVGISGGSAAALAFGPMIGACAALGVGGSHPSGMVALARKGHDHFAFDRLRAGTPHGSMRMASVFGEDCIRDSIRGRLLAMTIPGCAALPVRGVAVHAVLVALMQRDALARFLREVLLGDAPPADGIWQS
jgi:hypothetical protein